MLTLLAFHTTMPLRPAALPSESLAPNCWALGSALHGDDPALVPSTTTPERFMPRTCRFALVM